VLGRIGGDEFVVLLREVAGAQNAMGVAQRIGESLRGACTLPGASVHLQVSVGVACVDDRDADAPTLIARADMAMYRSKQRGLGQPVLAV
jgi:diguanylate cyclase (GGDEF)-like protein